jgi:hypothetical protein
MLFLISFLANFFISFFCFFYCISIASGLHDDINSLISGLFRRSFMATRLSPATFGFFASTSVDCGIF